jgi:hypothetical protein
VGPRASVQIRKHRPEEAASGNQCGSKATYRTWTSVGITTWTDTALVCVRERGHDGDHWDHPAKRGSLFGARWHVRVWGGA